MNVEAEPLHGEEGSACDDCWHLFCYHCHEDSTDGTVAGCQVKGCKCKRIWEGD